MHDEPRFPILPHGGRATVLAWIGWQQWGFRHGLNSLGLHSFARPLHYDDALPPLSLFDETPGHLVLDPCTYLRQIPQEIRSQSFLKTTYGGHTTTFVPSEGALTLTERQGYAEGLVEQQREAGATVILNPYHLVGGSLSSGRRMDIDLAARATHHFHSEALDEPHPNSQTSIRRQMYAAIGIAKDSLKLNDLERLANLYAALEVDGYWLRADSFSDSGKIAWVEAIGFLIGVLQATGRPVIVAQPGRLMEALLANDVSCAIGVVGYERFALPTEASNGPNQRFAYHPDTARSVAPLRDAGKRSFKSLPCLCGAHLANVAPTGDALVHHNAITHLAEARAALSGSTGERRERALEHVVSARKAAKRLDLGSSVSPAKVSGLYRGMDGAAPGRQSA